MSDYDDQDYVRELDELRSELVKFVASELSRLPPKPVSHQLLDEIRTAVQDAVHEQLKALENARGEAAAKVLLERVQPELSSNLQALDETAKKICLAMDGIKSEIHRTNERFVEVLEQLAGDNERLQQIRNELREERVDPVQTKRFQLRQIWKKYRIWIIAVVFVILASALWGVNRPKVAETNRPSVAEANRPAVAETNQPKVAEEKSTQSSAGTSGVNTAGAAGATDQAQTRPAAAPPQSGRVLARRPAAPPAAATDASQR